MKKNNSLIQEQNFQIGLGITYLLTFIHSNLNRTIRHLIFFLQNFLPAAGPNCPKLFDMGVPMEKCKSFRSRNWGLPFFQKAQDICWKSPVHLLIFSKFSNFTRSFQSFHCFSLLIFPKFRTISFFLQISTNLSPVHLLKKPSPFILNLFSSILLFANQFF